MGRMRIMRKWEMTYEICIQDIKKKQHKEDKNLNPNIGSDLQILFQPTEMLVEGSYKCQQAKCITSNCNPNRVLVDYTEVFPYFNELL